MEQSVRQQKLSMFHSQIPTNNTTSGSIHQKAYNSQTNDFRSNYRCTLDTCWSSNRTSRPDPPLLMQSSELYHKSVGQVPGYGGHVPGDINRFGKTYGSDTKDPKRYIRGDAI